jgi:hypothetical protein
MSPAVAPSAKSDARPASTQHSQANQQAEGVDFYAPFNQTYTFMTPKNNPRHNQTLHPDVDHLLNANAEMSCLQAGSSDLAQATFKMMRNTNMMRFGTNMVQSKVDNDYQRMRDEMLERQRHNLQQVAEFKQSVIDAKDKKKRLQSENGAIWLQAAELKRQKKQSLKDEHYDCETVWNIEGPDRKVKEKVARTAVN